LRGKQNIVIQNQIDGATSQIYHIMNDYTNTKETSLFSISLVLVR